MNADSTTHIVLPLLDPARERSGFQVARTLADTFHADLRVVASGAQMPTAQDLARQLSVPGAQVENLTIENTADDLAEATVNIADALPRAMMILTIHVRDETGADDAAPMDAIGRQILEKATGPVLIVPPDKDMSGWQLRKELLPQDGTPDCATALEQVIRHSLQRGVENLVLRVAGARVGQPTEPGSLSTPRYVDHPQYEWEAWGQEFLGRIAGLGTSLNTAGLRLLMASGEPAAEILRVAREESVDMIVLPWHCAFGSGRARMVKAVLHDAACPVLLLPEPCDTEASQAQH